MSSKTATSITTSSPTDQDVLCGRGKGIRAHPGNALYNRLLRENYDEYKAAPKGFKASIVKQIIAFVREGQPNGRGRFLERTKRRDADTSTSTNSTNSTWWYIDIGNERAMNKTAQAFRDIRVVDKPYSSIYHHNNNNNTRMTAEDDDASDGSGSFSVERMAPATGRAPSIMEDSELQGDDKEESQQQHHQSSRRPTFRERIAMLHRQQHREARCESSDDDDESKNKDDNNNNSNNNNNNNDKPENSRDSTEESGNEDEMSDTETEDSFQMYNPSNPPIKH